MGCYEVSYIIVLLSASPFMSVSICSMYFSASMMGVCVCVCVCVPSHSPTLLTSILEVWPGGPEAKSLLIFKSRRRYLISSLDIRGGRQPLVHLESLR